MSGDPGRGVVEEDERWDDIAPAVRLHADHAVGEIARLVGDR